jgi:hypothetical protein
MPKLSDYSFDDQMNYFRLLDLQGKLRAFDYDKLGLKYLDTLRAEVAQLLKDKYGVV